MTQPITLPHMLRTDTSNAFAHRTIRERLPRIARETMDLNPDYDERIMRAVDQLRADLENDAPLRPLDLPAPDFDDWQAALALHEGETWQSTIWLLAEHYFYRQMMQATRFFETGRDPFAPKKRDEIEGETLWQVLDAALRERELPTREQLHAVIAVALWGNRIDLSMAEAMAHGTVVADGDLLVDERERAVDYLLSQPRVVHLIADNAGTELASDLVLVDALLDGVAERVVLHLKFHPTFVSDATVSDVQGFIEHMLTERTGAAHAFARRLRAAFTAGRLVLAPDFFWNSSRVLWDLPERFRRQFTPNSLVISKGDANYRRMVADVIWPPATSLADVLTAFPAPVLALRTMKSDPAAGLPAESVAQLDRDNPGWRVIGKYGLIQCTAPES